MSDRAQMVWRLGYVGQELPEIGVGRSMVLRLLGMFALSGEAF
ncbi:MAG: hypothetical protein M0Z96_05080 [Actinomycetota bacterium]|nr:hypothetical protein [Actinomycetota bacterium]